MSPGTDMMIAAPPVVRAHGDEMGRLLREGKGSSELTDFSANVNCWGPSSAVEEAAREAISLSRYYPDPTYLRLRQAIAEYVGIPWECVWPGNGSADLLFGLVSQLHPTRAMVAAPAFCEYELALRAAGAQIKHLHLSAEGGFAVDLRLGRRLAREVDLAILGHPNNPTGGLLPPLEGTALTGTILSMGGRVIIDEAFLDFHPDRQLLSWAQQACETRNLFVLGSLTKFFGIPGLRLGYVVGRPDALADFAACSSPWSVNCVAEAAAIAALADPGFIEVTRRKVVLARGRLTRGLELLRGLTPYPSSANFILVRIDAEGWSSERLASALRERGLLVRDCASFTGLGERFLRVAVRGSGDNRSLLRVLREVVD